MKIGGEERKFEAINQRAFAGKKLLNLDSIQQVHRSDYTFPHLIDLFKEIDPDLFYNAYEKIKITHINTLVKFASHEKYHNKLLRSLQLPSDYEIDNLICIDFSNHIFENLSKNPNTRDFYNKFIHYFSIKSSIREIQEFLEK
jgi:hypothetical protein